MSKIKLEVGKTYRNRKGTELVKIIRKVSSKPFSYIGNDGCYYTENGKWIYGCNEDLEDLIEEVPETRHTFTVPDGVKKVTVEQCGNRIVVEMVPEKEPKPGDVMVNDSGSVYIFKDVYGSCHKDYAWLGDDGRLVIGGHCFSGRPATAEESKPLFDALKKAGKRWNAETMEVEEIPEIDRIREWMKGRVPDGYYTYQGIAYVIEAYLMYREGEK